MKNVVFCFQYGGKSVFKDIKTDLKNAWSSFSSAAQKEARSKSELIRQALPAIDEFTDAMAAEYKKLSADLATSCDAWNKMVTNNEFFLKDIKKSTDKTVEFIK